MKTNSALRAIFLLGFLLNAVLSWADGNPPDRMTYQGYLTDADGNPLGSTNTGPKNYDVIFRIYADTSGTTKLWSEQQTLTVDKGYFSVLLGEGAEYSSEPHPALNTVFSGATASDRYIEVTVIGLTSQGSLTTIAPRLRLLSSPYAFLARNAVSANALANSTSAQVVSIFGTSVGINKASPGTALDVNGTVSATGLAVAGTAGVTTLLVTNNGTVSGTLSAANLNVSGTAGISTLRVTNNATVSGSLTVTGSITNTGTTTATAFVGNGTIPIGGIIMWSGSISSIPAGWALCNGLNNTPNLTNRFVIAASLTTAPGTAGGAASHTITTSEMPAHTHTIEHHGWSFHGGVGDSHTIQLLQTEPGVSPYYTGTNGTGQAFSTLPPYYALAFIMRVQ